MPKVVVNIPECMLNFKCDRKKCQSRCCNKFEMVYFTKKAYEAMLGSKNEKLAKAAKKHIKLNEESITNYDSYILRLEDGCPLLELEGECLVESSLGEQFMGHPCRDYPKNYLNVSGELEIGISLLCKEALRRILTQKDGLKIATLQRKIDKSISGQKYTDVFGKYLGYIPELRSLALAWIGNRDFSISSRLLMMATIFTHLDGLFAVQDPKRGEFLKLYKKGLSKAECEAAISKFKSNFKEQFALSYILSDLLALGEDDELDQLLGFVQQFTDGLDGNIGLCAKGYQQAYEEYFEPFEREHGYIFENLLVSEAINDGVPLLRFKNLGDSVLYLAVYYALTRFIICMQAMKDGKITLETVFNLLDCVVSRFNSIESDYEHGYDGIMTKRKLILIFEKLKEFKLKKVQLINGLLGHTEEEQAVAASE